MENTSFEIAKVKESEREAIEKAERTLKAETGKDFVLIAWERKVVSFKVIRPDKLSGL